jgi:CreA protein
MRPHAPLRAALLRAALLLLVAAPAAAQQRIGSVNTAFKLLGPDDKIIVERYDDPKVPGASCYVSRATVGGIKGAVGVAEDRSRFSVACRATAGGIQMPRGVPQQEEVFSASTSLLFKSLVVTRMLDADKGVIVYLATSTKLIDGSPFNSVSAITVGRQ